MEFPKEQKIKTSIWKETPREDNVFSPRDCELHGENYYERLICDLSHTELLYFHLKRRKPSEKEAAMLEFFLNLCSNPGIRDEASMTAMNVAIGGPRMVNAVMAGLMARSGDNRGAVWVEKVMDNLLKCRDSEAKLTDFEPYTGLGKYFGSPDARISEALRFLKKRDFWGGYCALLEKNSTGSAPILLEGLFAAGMLDSGFSPEEGSLLFLISAAPALFIYAAEQRENGYKNFPSFFKRDSYS